MAEKKRRKVASKERRRGYNSGVAGVRYVYGGYYLSPAQFGYTTAQAEGGYGGGQMTTTGGDAAGGDSGGATA